MDITLNIGLEVSRNYLPDGVEKMTLQFKYVEDVLNNIIGEPHYVGMAQSLSEKTLVVQYTNVDLTLHRLFWLARESKQDCIAYRIKDNGHVLGGALVGEYAHEWNHGIFDNAYFIEDTFQMDWFTGWPL